MKYRFLYRALRKIEIDSDYNLIPKVFTDTEFVSDPVLGIDTTFPIEFGSTVNIVRQHQWNQNGLPTKGISATPFYKRALFYAQTNKVIVKIDTNLFNKLGINMYDVNEVLASESYDIAVPEDNEIILTYKNKGVFPKKIITEIIKI